jgi:plasmid stability protein
MAQDTPSRHADKAMLRMPDGMRDRLRSAAAANNRTMNAEVVAAIEQWLSGQTQQQLDRIEAACMELLERLK